MTGQGWQGSRIALLSGRDYSHDFERVPDRAPHPAENADLRKASEPRLKVLLAEEEALVRGGLQRMLEDDFRVAGAVADFESLRAAVS